MKRHLLMGIFAVASLGTWLAIPALAQETPRGEFVVYVAEGHMGGQEGTYGKGAEQGASVEIRPFSRIGFMIDVNRLNHSGSILNANGTPDRWDISKLSRTQLKLSMAVRVIS